MVREDSAKSFLSHDWVLKPENCIRPTVRPDDEIKQLVCGVFASEADVRYVRNIIVEQRALSGIFLTLGFWGFVSMIVAGSKAQAARRVFEQCARKMPASGEKLNPWKRGEHAP